MLLDGIGITILLTVLTMLVAVPVIVGAAIALLKQQET
jgi:ABC-type phosphate transport system permease subunit